ncbi:hypothetical protein U1Q18_050240 [Sarracenia purpurea var. burkii]
MTRKYDVGAYMCVCVKVQRHRSAVESNTPVYGLNIGDRHEPRRQVDLSCPEFDDLPMVARVQKMRYLG